MRIPDSVLYTTQLFLAIFFRSPATAGTYFREFFATAKQWPRQSQWRRQKRGLVKNSLEVLNPLVDGPQLDSGDRITATGRSISHKIIEITPIINNINSTRPAMRTKTFIPEYTISELYLNIWKSGTIDKNQLQEIQSAINSQTSRSSDDQKIISRLLYAVRRGWLSVMD